MNRPDSTAVQQAHGRFVDYIGNEGFPCVGARAALNRKRYRFALFDTLGSDSAARLLCTALYEYMAEFQAPGTDPVSFIAGFESGAASEQEFEALLWTQLQAMHAADRERFAWDPRVSRDAASSEFSFSIGGRALFVVGLHPHASRLSRRAPQSTLVFNFHEQFQLLRSNGKYEGMQKVVRQRDLALQGSINPVLARFGEASEALQYSGRAVPADWQCPFKAAA